MVVNIVKFEFDDVVVEVGCDVGYGFDYVFVGYIIDFF